MEVEGTSTKKYGKAFLTLKQTLDPSDVLPKRCRTGTVFTLTSGRNTHLSSPQTWSGFELTSSSLCSLKEKDSSSITGGARSNNNDKAL